MDDNQDAIDLFEAYNNDQLSAEARKEFEQRLHDDPKFKEAHELFEVSLAMIKREGFKTEIAQLLEESDAKTRKLSPYVWVGGIAASLLIGVSVVVFNSNQRSQDFFGSYYSTYPNVLSVRASSNSVPGIEDYTSGDFAKAIETFSMAPQSDTIQFYLGLSYVEVSNYALAKVSLQTIPESSIFYPQKQWYLALIHLKGKNEVEAKKLLSQIKPGDYKYKESQTILDQLD